MSSTIAERVQLNDWYIDIDTEFSMKKGKEGREGGRNEGLRQPLRWSNK